MTSIYTTGVTPAGEQLIGGVWRLAHQDGFPLELSYVLACQGGWRIDWREAMADASLDDNLPALMRQIESFLDESSLLQLKVNFVRVMEHKSPQQVMDEKKCFQPRSL